MPYAQMSEGVVPTMSSKPEGREKNAPVKFKELSQSIEALESTVIAVTNSLNRVLRPVDNDRLPKTEFEVPPPDLAICPLANEINYFRSKIDRITSDLQVLYNNIDV